jgi:signal transduction histidine kinase/ligand-binding sensor domain-containing protein
MRRFSFLLAIALLVLPVQAQDVPTNPEVSFEGVGSNLPIRFENVTLEDGLSQSTVYSIAQDSKGFMWFGTELGLNRYDGTRIERFMPDPFDSTSIHDTFIWEIVEDDEGYLWMNYEDGTVGRFDPTTGKSRNYFSSAVDTTRLDPTRSVFMDIDSKNRIWVSSLNGFQQLDPETGTVTRYGSHSENGGDIGWTAGILQEGDGDTFIITGANSVRRFDLTTVTFTKLFDVPSGSTMGTQDPRNPNVYWIGSLDDGVFRLDTTDDSWQHYDVTVTDADEAIAAQPDPNEPGIVWVGTIEGVVRLNERTGSYQTYRSGTGSNPDNGELLSNAISRITADRSGILWASTGGYGVTRFDPTAMGFVKGEASPDNPNTMRGETVWAIYPESNGLLWVLAFGSESSQPGWYLNRIDRNTGQVQFQLTHSDQNAPLLRTSTGDLLVGSQPNTDIPNTGGVLAWDDRTGRLIQRYTVANGMLPNDRVRDIVELDDGILFVGTRGGVSRINQRTAQREFWSLEESRGLDVELDYVWRMLKDSRENVWVSSFGTLIVFPEGRMEPINFFDREDAPENPRRFLPRVKAEDAAGNIWVALIQDGAKSVLMKYDPEADKPTYYRYDSNDRTTWSGGTVTGIHPHPEDPDIVVFNSYGAGISMLDVSTGEFTHYNGEDGLMDPAIYQGLWDADMTLWAPTNSGLYRFDPVTETFRRFGMEYGLQSLEFNEGVLARSESNELFFGGVQGFNAFFPTQLRTNNVEPDVAITKFMLFNHEVTPGPGSPLEKSIIDTERIVLAHDQDAPSFQFAALHYKRPEANRIRYRLEPEQMEWIDAEGRNEASYTNLSPGEYTFRVIAANSDGVWNADGATVRLTILSPWYTRWWAYLLYAGFLGLAVFAVDRIQRERLVRKEREATRERELQQAKEVEKAYEQLKRTKEQLVEQEKLASLGSLTAGIAHEIKNPLNFVNNFAEVGAELAEELAEAVAKGDSEGAKAILAEMTTNSQQIAKHGKRADSIVRSMMQHAKGGVSQREKVDINEYVEEYSNLAWHGMRAREHGFQADVQRQLGDDVGSTEVLPQELGRVLLNLFNNAYYAVMMPGAGEKPTVTVSTKRLGNGRIEIRVADNGPGIPAEVRDKIFEPFFTTKPTGEGTGLGLSLSHDIIVNGHGGTMRAEEAPGGGACFIIELPA